MIYEINRNIKCKFLIILFVAGLMHAPLESIKACDTTETWDDGATDLDFYVGFDGIGPKRAERIIYSDIMLGYGLIKNFSAYLGTTLKGNEYLGNGQATIYLGIFGTPLDTSHFDIDLFLDFSGSGTAFSELKITPSSELNFDLDPGQKPWGMYLRIGIPVYGYSVTLNTIDSIERKIAFSIDLNPGTYLTIAKKHQLFLEYDMSIRPSPINEECYADIGEIAIGYNVKISECIELINQISFNIPQQDEPWSIDLMVGFISTLPSARQGNLQ